MSSKLPSDMLTTDTGYSSVNPCIQHMKGVILMEDSWISRKGLEEARIEEISGMGLCEEMARGS